MPKVIGKGIPTVQVSVVPIQTNHITQAEMLEFGQIQADLKALDDVYKPLEKKAEKLMFGFMERATGLKTKDEWRLLGADKIEALVNERFNSGAATREDGKADFAIALSKSETRPAWEKAFTKMLGDAAANQVRSETPMTHSYKVVITDVTIPPSITVTKKK